MNLNTGFNRHYVPAGIAGGVLIAYICNGNDTNINHPLGRVLIKPCIREGEQIQANPANFILRCSNAYGTFSNTYIKQLQDWLDKHWNDEIKASPGKYKLTEMAYRENADMDWEYTEDNKWKKRC